MKRILVLKGGGVRGILQLDALRVLEKHYKKKIAQIFDLIVGTSIGSITGGILATGKLTMDDYLELFLKYIPKIFQSYWWRKFVGTKYNRRAFYNMWDDLFNPNPIYMKDCITKFMCTAVNLCDFRTHFFKSWEKKDGDQELKYALAKSFAAPYFFGQFVDPKEKAVWVDGGAGDTNTPLDFAFTEYLTLGWTNELVEFIVIGTGTADYSIPFTNARNLGQIRQLLTYMNPTQGGLARLQSTLNQIERMKIVAKASANIDFRYYDIEVGKRFDGTDKVRYIQEYLAFGRLIAEKVAKDLNESTLFIDRESFSQYFG